MKKLVILMMLSCLLCNFASAQRSEGTLNVAVNAGYVKGFKSLGNDCVTLEAIGGYQFNTNLFVGAGVGGMYVTGKEEAFRLPIFADARYDFLDNGISPFAEVQVGYNLGFGDQEGAFHLNPQLGARVSLTEKLGLNIGVGYLMLPLEGGVGSGMTFKIGVDF